MSIGTPSQEMLARPIALYRNREYARAAAETKPLLNAYPDSFLLWSLYGSICTNLGDPVAGEVAIRKALSLASNAAAIHHNLGICLSVQHKLDEALSAFERALQLDASLADTQLHKGHILRAMGKTNEALRAYDEATRLRPNLLDAYYSRGETLMEIGEWKAALPAFARTIQLNPGLANAHYKQGIAFMQLSLLDNSAASLRRAIEIDPQNVDVHNALGTVLYYKRDFRGTIDAFDDALRFKPDITPATVLKFHAHAHLCEFTNASKMRVGVDEIPPFPALAYEDDPKRQHARSESWWKLLTNRISPTPLERRQTRNPKLRVGWFSSDFHNHATMHLMSGLFREHDRSRFDFFVYSYGESDNGPLRRRLQQDVAHFQDVKVLNGEQICQLARTHNLDIAIDLKGYTADGRSELFARRLAPIQISYLGYPGTMGSSIFDYIVADRVVIPDEYRPFYTENVMYMPHTYQPNDELRMISEAPTSRSDFGLPNDAVVLCCFNNCWKISSKEFDIWMRVMRQVPHSVLWLIRANGATENNLRQEASARGVAPERLIFAERLPQAEHLARHRHADLFLDTFNYNAHTTTSDALWAGLPVVTKPGKQFAARVAASLLNAIGLPELVTHSERQYETTILNLVREPRDLSHIREKLVRNRSSNPLFDTKRYVRNFERALLHAFQRYTSGQIPSDIEVPEELRPHHGTS